MPTDLDPERLLAELDKLIGLPPARSPAAPGAPSAAPPRAAVPPAPDAAGPPRARRSAGARILITDDSKDFRRLLRALFAGKGFKVLEAKDGLEGLRTARAEKPDLIVLDFDMPQMNGYEMLQELRRRDETRKLPVILLTGAPNRQHLKAMGLDVAEFLEKPVENAMLLDAVQRVLDSRPLEIDAAAAEAAPAVEHPDGGCPMPPQEPEPEESPEAASEAEVPEDIPEVLEEEQEAADDLLIEEQKKEKEEDQAGLDVLANDSPLVNRVNRILVRAVSMGASDIHIEPREKVLMVRVRVDGALRLLQKMPVALAPQVSARVKIMSNLIITERRRPQDGQVRATIRGKKVEFRVSTIPSLYGEKIVMRVLGGAKLKASLSELKLLPRDLEAMRRALESPHGLLLVTGPTGSGKTTTLYTMIRQLNTSDVNIMTAEDPVEYELDGITQVPVKAHIGVTFESILRSFLRQDPDIMLVGEIRDLETAEIAVKAAITGHLVLSTLHTNSAPAAVSRLAHMGVAGYLIADSVKLIVAQRLVRRLCPTCRVEAPVPERLIRLLGDSAKKIRTSFIGKGCAGCGKTGYSGRMPIFEVMEVRSPEMRQLILSASGADKIARQAEADGMVPLREAALEAVSEGGTSVEEALNIMLSE